MPLGIKMVVNDNIALDKAVELYAKMGMAMSDAAVAIWEISIFIMSGDL